MFDAVGRLVGEAAGLGHARVVDQDADAGIVAQAGFHVGQIGALGEVGRQDVYRDPSVLAQAGGQGFQARRVARDQHQVVAAAGEAFGVDGADAAGGAGDEDGGKQAHGVSLGMGGGEKGVRREAV
ncbi:hypothetical protein D3C81_1692830 [compost metagenome]